MKFSKYYLRQLTLAIVSVIVKSQTDAPTSTTEQATILWPLSPCQSAFRIPSASSEFSQNWTTYQYEGNPLSQIGECIFILESDLNTRIEIIIQRIDLFDKGPTVPSPCLLLYDVKMDGNIVLLRKECNMVLSANPVESVSAFTDTNLAVISTTIRCGSFQLIARAVPGNFEFPPTVSSTTRMSPTAPTVTVRPSSSTSISTTTARPTSIKSEKQSPLETSTKLTSPSTARTTASTRSFGQPRIIVKEVTDSNIKQLLP